MPDLTIRYSAAEKMLRSTNECPGIVVIAAMPPEHPPGFAIDGRIEPGAGRGRDVRARMDADLAGAEWFEPGEIVAALADKDAAAVLWAAVINSIGEAVTKCLAGFRIEEFNAYYELALATAAALGEAGYGPA